MLRPYTRLPHNHIYIIIRPRVWSIEKKALGFSGGTNWGGMRKNETECCTDRAYSEQVRYAYSDSRHKYKYSLSHQLVCSTDVLHALCEIVHQLVQFLAAWDERAFCEGARYKLETLRVVASCFFGGRHAQGKGCRITTD